METNKPIYPVEPWNVTETAFRIEDNYRNETVFSLSNGYIGTRGTFEEGYEFDATQGVEGNFIGGVYESEPIRYGEWSIGYPEYSQTMMNLPNMKTTRLYIGSERFDMRVGNVENYRRTLDLREGLVTRALEWTSPGGSRVRIETARLVSFAMKNIIASRLKVTPLNFTGEIRLRSILDADVKNHTGITNPLIDYGPYNRTLIPDENGAADQMLYYAGHTTNSGLNIACGSVHSLKGDITGDSYETCKTRSSVEYTARGEVTMDKFMAYTSSLDTDDDRLCEYIQEVLFDAAQEGFDELARKQKEYVSAFWEKADVQIDGDDEIQQGLRFNMYHIMQSATRDGSTGMGAKGLSGEGYEGHCFWDMEIYTLPMLILTCPELARNLLDFRYATLDPARARARILGHAQGALYPCRTINGEECSVNVPLGTAQYHINADVAYAFTQYVEVTGDTDYLKDKAAEVLCETARVWADVGCFSEARGGKYCICSVTGPDEYTAFVDNNFYTNLMARENLRDAVSAVKWIEENDDEAFDALCEKIRLRPEEPELWQEIADNMYLPYDEIREVFLPDDGFLLRKPWNEARISPEKQRLVYEYYHPLFIWRQRMSKQADTILAMFLHSEYFTQAELTRNYDFYREFTLHHSPLSICATGIVASLIGRDDEAYSYFREAVRMDLDDRHDNVYTGVHIANMAGAWQAIIFGFAGMQLSGGKLTLSPRLPDHWNGYSFRVAHKGMTIEVLVKKENCTVKLLSGTPCEVSIHGEERFIDPVK